MSITIINFHSQYSLDDVQACVDDITSSGGNTNWTSYTSESGTLEVEVSIDDEEAFRSRFRGTDSFNYSNYQ